MGLRAARKRRDSGMSGRRMRAGLRLRLDVGGGLGSATRSRLRKAPTEPATTNTPAPKPWARAVHNFSLPGYRHPAGRGQPGAAAFYSRASTPLASVRGPFQLPIAERPTPVRTAVATTDERAATAEPVRQAKAASAVPSAPRSRRRHLRPSSDRILPPAGSATRLCPRRHLRPPVAETFGPGAGGSRSADGGCGCCSRQSRRRRARSKLGDAAVFVAPRSPADPEFEYYLVSELEPAPAPPPGPPPPQPSTTRSRPLPRIAQPAAEPPKPQPPKSVGGGHLVAIEAVDRPRLRPARSASVEPRAHPFYFDLEMFNSGSAPARDLLVEVSLFNPGPTQEQESRDFSPAARLRASVFPVFAPLKRLINPATSIIAPREHSN